MKKLKIICFIMYLLSSVILIIPISFQNSIADNHDSFLIFYLIIYLIIITITVINSVILAKKLNRSEFGWGIFSFFMPYLSCFILPFLNEAEERSYSKSSSYESGSYGSTYMSDKSCSACGKSVSLSSLAGQSCPHCGAYWGSEREI